MNLSNNKLIKVALIVFLVAALLLGVYYVQKQINVTQSSGSSDPGGTGG